MANSVRFQMYSGTVVMISGDDPLRPDELTTATVKSIIVEGDPWVFFDSPCYGGDFVIYKAGDKEEEFPTGLKTIKSVRRINDGIKHSKVTLCPYPFFNGKCKSFQSDTPQLPENYFSLKVTEGAVVFFDDENYKGGKRILLKGDEVQNYTAVKLTSIGKSMKPVTEVWP